MPKPDRLTIEEVKNWVSETAGEVKLADQLLDTMRENERLRDEIKLAEDFFRNGIAILDKEEPSSKHTVRTTVMYGDQEIAVADIPPKTPLTDK